MIERQNISYGSVEPAAKIYETDHVILNSNIRKETRTDPEGATTYEWIAGTVKYYSYKEYAQMQDAAAAEQQEVNDELLLDLDARVAALEE